MKKLFTFIFALLFTGAVSAQSLEITQPLQMIENSLVLAQYQNLFGKYEMPEIDVSFPYSLISMRLEGSASEVKAAKEVLRLYLGTQKMVTDQYKENPNEILFLIENTVRNVYVTCGDGCERQLLASGTHFRPNKVYSCKVKYTPEAIEYGPKKPKITSQYLLINVTPADAIVEVDGNLWTNDGGVAGNLLEFGEHRYRISAPDHAPAEGKVTINDPNNTQSLTVQLKPRFCSVTLKVDNNAEIWVNGAKKGAGRWTGNLGYGPYRIETRLPGHVDGMVQQTITEANANQTIVLPSPTPIYGSLRVETKPFQSDIYIDGKNVGKTPKVLSEVIIGSHKIEIKMEGYEDLSTTQTITEGQMAVVGGALTEKQKEIVAVSVEGSAEELNTIGENYYYGDNGYTQDYAKAVEYYRKAAGQGNVDAQYSLGYCYAHGEGVSQDYSQAVYWFRKAAEQNHASAQYSLGYCYALGEGVSQDYSQAVYWYRKGAENGNASAQNNLGDCYYDGQGVSQDYYQAVSWYRKAAEQGNLRGQNNLGYCYEVGQGVSQNYSQAVYWYRKAAENGYELAQYNLGLCYDVGRGVSQDDSQAVYWYRKGAENGDANAQYKMGLGYCYGMWGLSTDKAKAKEYFQQAADQGNQKAIDFLNEHY